MDEVTKKWGNLSPTEREVVEHDLQDTELVEGAAIVAKFFTKRRVNLEAVANTLKSAWRTDLSFEVRDQGENKAIFLFEDETDMIRVLTNGPWTFDKYLLAVHKLGEEEQIQNISFDMVNTREKGKASSSSERPMDIIVAKKGDRSKNAMEEAGGMEVELTAETEEAKRVQHDTKITQENPGTSMSVGNGDMFEKTLAEIDEELGKNVTAAAGILGSLTKTKDTKREGDCFEFKGGKIDGVKARASGDTKGMGPSPDEEGMVGSIMGLGIYATTEEDSSNTGPLKVTNVKKPSQAKKPLQKNNTTPKTTRQNRRHNHSGDFSGDGLESKENDGFSQKSTKGTWKRLNREATNTVAMEGGLLEDGPKRKLLPPLGETDPNRVQEKRAKIDIDEIALEPETWCYQFPSLSSFDCRHSVPLLSG
nr:hypothetical protein CFP56_63306 [Quercus suber]